MHAPPVFVPRSIDHPGTKAKQLRRAFPHIPLSLAQEVAAQAMGYSSWYAWTSQRGAARRTVPSPDDLEVTKEERALRLAYQAGAITASLGIAPAEADLFVYCWGLTGKPTARASYPQEVFFQWERDLSDFEAGRMSLSAFEQAYEWAETGVPRRISAGVVAGPIDDNEYYALHPDLLKAVPRYLRGNHSVFLVDEDGMRLPLALPDAFPVPAFEEGLEDLRTSEPWLFEWFRETHRASGTSYGAASFKGLRKALPKLQDKWIALSVRERMSQVYSAYVGYYPCLRGAHFADYLDSGGVLNARDVYWFKDVDGHKPAVQWGLHEMYPEMSESGAPLLATRRAVQLDFPLYSSPFKHGPMGRYEYSAGSEGGIPTLLDGYPDDPEDDGDEPGNGDGSGGNGPDGLPPPVAPTNRKTLLPA